MKFILYLSLLLIFLFASLASKCAGGVWVLEVEYKAGNERHAGFIYADYWADDFEDRFLGKQKAFKKALLEKYGENELLTVYSAIHARCCRRCSRQRLPTPG